MEIIDSAGNSLDVGDLIEYSAKDGLVQAIITKITKKLEDRYDTLLRRFCKKINLTISVTRYGGKNRIVYPTPLKRMDRVLLIKKYEGDSE